MDQRILQRLEDVRKHGTGQYMSKCPAHQDRSPSLSLYFHNDGRILIHCFAGCQTSDILAAIGLSMTDLFPEPLSHFLPGGDKRAKELALQKKTSHERTVIEMCMAKRRQGKELTKDELEAERRAFDKIKGVHHSLV